MDPLKLLLPKFLVQVLNKGAELHRFWGQRGSLQIGEIGQGFYGRRNGTAELVVAEIPVNRAKELFFRL